MENFSFIITFVDPG